YVSYVYIYVIYIYTIHDALAIYSLDYYLFGGPTPKDALDQFTALSGRPALPPEWSFGLWLSTSFTTNYSEADVMANVERMESLRSEEHTSELQSRENRVCRLLPE